MRRLRTDRIAESLRRSAIRRAVASTKHRGLRPADVFLASYPRSGNSWVTLMLVELLGRGRVDLRADRQPPSMFGPGRAVSMIGTHRDAPGLLPGGGRLIKTHEPYRSEYRRAIYLVRDVRDVAASVFRMRAYEGLPPQEWAHFLDDFASGQVGGWRSWQDHVAGWCIAASGDANVLILRYEDLVDAPSSGLGRMAAFMGLEEAPDRLRAIADNHTPDEVRRMGGHTERSGRLLMANATYGGWRAAYTARQLAKLAPAMEVMNRMGYEVDIS